MRSASDRLPLLVVDAQYQEFVRMTLVVDSKRPYAPTPHDSTGEEPSDWALKVAIG
jgi:hypothetical protein